MHKFGTRVVAFVMTVALFVGCIPITMADETETEPEAQTAVSTLDLIVLMGQSNMEGQTANGYSSEIGQAVVCDENDIYSTVVPTSLAGANNVTGSVFTEQATVSNIDQFIPASLSSTKSKAGTSLCYQLNTLSAKGKGKTGLDAALAYEWNQITGHKVWIVNLAYGGSSINSWVPGGSIYSVAVAAIDSVLDVCKQEEKNGNIVFGQTLMFWLQGEADNTMSCNTYLDNFDNMVETLNNKYAYDGFGIISVRAANGSQMGVGDIATTGPREAQVISANAHKNVFMVSEANEQWISDSGVKNYFQTKYPNGFGYTVRSGNATMPTRESDIHPNIHYTQAGHNENGITAADGMCEMLKNPPDVIPESRGGLSMQNGSLVYMRNGAVDTSYTGFAEYNGDWYYVKSGTVSMTRNDILEGTANGQNGWWYIVNGKIDFSYTGVSNFSNAYGWWYIKNGKVDFSKTSVEPNQYGWWYVKGGKVDFSKTGIEKNDYGWWRIVNGQVDFSCNSVESNDYGWWYLLGGQVQFGYTGVADYANAYGWWYIKDGKVDFGFNGIASNSYGNWYCEGGKVIFSKNGTYSDSTGTWKITNGQATLVSSSKTGFYQDGDNWYYYKNGTRQTALNDILEGTVNGQDGWWYIVNGKVDFSYTGVSNFSNAYGWWYIKNGKVDFSKTGVEQNNYGWWRVVNGKVDFSCNSVEQNDYGWWYIVGGKVQFGYTGVANYANAYGWWYIKDGKVDFTKTGVEQNNYGWWRVVNGKVDFSCNSVEQNDYGWWYIVGGKVQSGYTGVANYANDYGWWYIKDGKVDFSKYSVEQNNYGWWLVEGGKVNFNYTGVSNYSNPYGWWYLKNGKVDFSFSGIAANKYGNWYCDGGQVRFTMSGQYKDESGIWTITNGEAKLTTPPLNSDYVTTEGTVSQDVYNNAVTSYNDLPGWVKTLFENAGWKICVSSLDFASRYGYSGIGGLTVYSDKTIFVCADTGCTSRDGIWHEMSHFVDYTIGRPSKTDEFEAITSAEGPTMKNYFNWYISSITPSEYFAEASYFYWDRPNELKRVAPQTYEYIKNTYSAYEK